jgi:hypothetical protein
VGGRKGNSKITYNDKELRDKNLSLLRRKHFTGTKIKNSLFNKYYNIFLP